VNAVDLTTITAEVIPDPDAVVPEAGAHRGVYL
jgi:hypothetical protein